MKIWLVLAICSYLSYSISTTIDKILLNKDNNPLILNTVKMFFNGLVILMIGFLFFEISITIKLLSWSLILGGLYALAGLFYLNGLNNGDAQKIVPFMQASQMILIFLSSWILFKDNVSLFNFIGFCLIIIGIFFVLSKKFIFPKIDGGIKFVLALVVVNTIYSLLVKKSLSDIQPINISLMMYFVSSIFLFFYLLFKKKSQEVFKIQNLNILPASFFGASGTFLLYLALNFGEASKVYSIAGVEIIFISFFSIFILKEKFSLSRFLGIIIIVFGIILISM